MMAAMTTRAEQAEGSMQKAGKCELKFDLKFCPLPTALSSDSHADRYSGANG
jgi:hypothetical protein